MRQSSKRTAVIAAGVTAFTLATRADTASAASAAVQAACTGDYYAYCGKHDPVQDASGVNACMKANGKRLSQRCVEALVADGQVSKAELGGRTAKK